MKHKFTINHKAFTLFGCLLAAALFIASCVLTDPEPAQGSNNYEAASQIVDKDLDLFQ